ncbi:MAG: hypothetical protein ISS70_20010 [Phycisphaerae bacterium]|nr:hypothetical protein [Phycisphaerae bacterium]
MAENENPAEDKAIPPQDLVPWSEFLEDYPLNSVQNVSEYYEKTHSQYGDPFRRLTPTLRLHCSKCKGVRNFSGRWTHHDTFSNGDVVHDFVKYTCKDCEDASKTFCVISQAIGDNGNGCALKIGEFPELHLELPRSVEKLLGDDYKLFVKGLTCEKRGLGIGAFTYYRRVVEAQKNHLIAEILRVAEKLGGPADIRDKLKAAQKEKQFSRAVDAVKGVIPESLLVDSHNPLKLLHNALSICVHAEPDEQCLRIAHSIRLVLVDLSERLKLALGEQDELRTAVSDLLNFTAEAKKKAKD